MSSSQRTEFCILMIEHYNDIFSDSIISTESFPDLDTAIINIYHQSGDVIPVLLSRGHKSRASEIKINDVLKEISMHMKNQLLKDYWMPNKQKINIAELDNYGDTESKPQKQKGKERKSALHMFSIKDRQVSILLFLFI